MDGILIIDKPAGITSHDVVYRVRRILNTKRVGHTGTLDPFATGVMVILVGRATRLAQYLDKDEKEYGATVRFGFETDTGDRTGSPLFSARTHLSLDSEDVESVVSQFRGEIEQTPPMYSAKKIDGKKLYELARKGETVERNVVTVNISKLEISSPPVPTGQPPVTWDMGLTVACSAGTYVRTLAVDIGRRLGVGAHLAELRRTRAGTFDITQSTTLDAFAEMNDPTSRLVSMKAAVSHLPSIVLTADRVSKTKTGLSTRVFGDRFAAGEAVLMLDEAGELIAVGIFDESENSVLPKVVLV